jgi:hypothetical protein
MALASQLVGQASAKRLLVVDDQYRSRRAARVAFTTGASLIDRRGLSTGVSGGYDLSAIGVHGASPLG